MNRHIVLTLGRSGSNTLCDMLNQHPEVYNIGEVLGSWTRFRKLQKFRLLPGGDEDYLDYVLYSDRFFQLTMAAQSANAIFNGRRNLTKSRNRIRTFGAKDFSLNFSRFGLDLYLHERDVKVIGLRRLSVPARMLSNALLTHTGIVAVKDSTFKNRQIKIDPNRITTMLATIERENSELEKMLAALPPERCQTVEYEELFSSPDRRQLIMSGVFRFLGVEPISVETTMNKIVTKPLNETIANFDACLEAVRGTRYEEMLLAEIART